MSGFPLYIEDHWKPLWATLTASGTPLDLFADAGVTIPTGYRVILGSVLLCNNQATPDLMEMYFTGLSATPFASRFVGRRAPYQRESSRVVLAGPTNGSVFLHDLEGTPAATWTVTLMYTFGE